MFGKLIPRREKHRGALQTRTEEGHPVARLRREFDQLWDRFLEDWHSGDLTLWDDGGTFGVPIDLDDREKEFVLRAELPGFEPDEIDVNVSGNVLTVRAEHREEEKGGEEKGSYQRYGSFYESLTLPQGVREEEIDARYHSGVLEIHLPKGEEAQAKRIAVKAD